jgi:hypothetical protein
MVQTIRQAIGTRFPGNAGMRITGEMEWLGFVRATATNID